MRGKDNLMYVPPPEGPPPAGVFAGLRVHLHGPGDTATQSLGQLLQHAGG